MENKDVFMAAYARAEEKNNLQHAVFGSPASGFMRDQVLTGAENAVTRVVDSAGRRLKKNRKRNEKTLRKLGKKAAKTGEKIADAAGTVGGWYGKE